MDSADRIATTHVGSLPRSDMVSDVVLAIEQGAAVSEELFDAVISDAVDVAVASQKKIGIDIVSDGEFSKATYASYVQHRLTGFSGNSALVTPADLDEYPGAAEKSASRRGPESLFKRPECTGPVGVRTRAPVDDDIRRMSAAVAQAQAEQCVFDLGLTGANRHFSPQPLLPHARRISHCPRCGNAGRVSGDRRRRLSVAD